MERSTHSQHLEPGGVVDDYRLVAPIGQGGMGQVWAAEQISLGGRRVALKFVKPERVTARGLEAFQREARAGGRLHHPGIVAVHAYGEIKGLAWIAMELIEGARTLRDLIDERASADELAPDHDRNAARLASQVADAMQAAHDAGVVHRDLKPRNILMGPDGRPRVSDLGLARITDESTLSDTGEFAGTYFYTSPEQVAARRVGIDHRADVFSLGVVLYEMLGLQRPFRGDTSHQVASQTLEKEPPDLRSLRSRIPEELAVITAKALEKDRDHRYSTMAELSADLRRFMAHQPILARPPGAARRMWKWCLRHPARSSAGAMAALALVVVSGLSFGLARKSVEASTHASQALRVAEQERLRRDEVLRLSAWQEYEDLMAEVDQLWPAHPEEIDRLEAWLDRAQGLIDQLPVHLATLETLRAAALPYSEERLRAEMEAHPAFAEFQALGHRIEAQRSALLARQGTPPDVPEIPWSEYSLPDGTGWIGVSAWSLVRPDRRQFGREMLGLALARRGLEMERAAAAPSGDRARAAVLLSWACLSVGLLDEARETRGDEALTEPALEEIDSFERHAILSLLEDLDGALRSAEGETGLLAMETELAALEAEHERLAGVVGERLDWRYPEGMSTVRWWDRQLTKLVRAVRDLEDARTGLLVNGAFHPDHGASVATRLSRARRLRDDFSPGGLHGARWEQDLPALRTAYPGLGLGAQMGLVPIGADPESGLWEFWHVGSGDEPQRDDQGVLRPTEETGLVFVLLPGGDFLMGAQGIAPGWHNYDADALGWEASVHPVVLSPFFLSKYEMTREQWTRCGGPWSFEEFEGLQPDVKSLPVSRMSWFDCDRELLRIGCALPTEEQWEYGCRGGSAEPRPFAVSELAEHANVADLRLAQTLVNKVPHESWDDGHGLLAPVGSYRPNSHGLHDMLGNAYEWVADTYYLYEDRYPLSGPTFHNSSNRVRRGGSYLRPAKYARSGARATEPPSKLTQDLGLRPARRLDE